MPPRNRIPYVEEYMLSIERQLGANTVLSISYVGAQGHRLLVMEEANPGIPALCLANSRLRSFCGAGKRTRGPLGSNFGSDTLQKTIGKSNYNSLQLSLRHTSGRLELSAGYTYGKSMDDSSNLGEEINPVNPAISYALSSFDIRHNFVVSYNYRIPFESLFRASNRWTKGWEISGITRFSTGLPVTLYNNTDSSLLGTNPNGINNNGVDTPYFTPRQPETQPQSTRQHRGLQHRALLCARDQPAALPLARRTTSRAASSPAPARRTSTCRCRRKLRCTRAKCCSSASRPSTSSITPSSSAHPPSTETSAICATFGQIINAMPPRLMQLAAKFLF